jgi:hypothetical protein
MRYNKESGMYENKGKPKEYKKERKEKRESAQIPQNS